MLDRSLVPSLVAIILVVANSCYANEPLLDPNSTHEVHTPIVTKGDPHAGKRVAITPPEYTGTKVFHTLYLPPDWKRDGPKLPIIFEYTGNYFPKSGSSGEPEDAGLGFGLSGGEYIWVSLPYINEAHNDNQVTWWGDENATVDYAKKNVPKIIDQYNANPNAVFLCGFSRGAIGVNYLGLHDDEVAKLWTAFISHDHFDGVKQWRAPWGAPLEKYRKEAAVRLKRIGDRPYLVSQNGSVETNKKYIRSVLPDVSNFTFATVKTAEIFGQFPNEIAKHPHTDRWLCKPSPYRERSWQWMNNVVSKKVGSVDPN